MQFVETIPREFNRTKVYTFAHQVNVAGNGVASEDATPSVTLDEDVIIVGLDLTLLWAVASDGEPLGIGIITYSHIPGIHQDSDKEANWATLAVHTYSPFAKVDVKEKFGAYIRMPAESTIYAYIQTLVRNPSGASLYWRVVGHVYTRVKG